MTNNNLQANESLAENCDLKASIESAACSIQLSGHQQVLDEQNNVDIKSDGKASNEDSNETVTIQMSSTSL